MMKFKTLSIAASVAFLFFSSASYAGFLDQLQGAINSGVGQINKGVQSAIGGISSSDGNQNYSDRDSAVLKQIQSGARQQGFQGGRGEVIVFVGNPGGRLPQTMPALASKLHIPVLKLSNDLFSRIVFRDGPNTYATSLSNFITACTSDLSSCDFHMNFYDYIFPPSAHSDSIYLSENMMLHSDVSADLVISELNSIKQRGTAAETKLYVFIDPSCSVCMSDYLRVQNNLSHFKSKYPHVSINWVPTDLFGDENSLGQAEQMIRDGFPALNKNYEKFDRQHERGGLSNQFDSSFENDVLYNDTAIYYLTMKYGFDSNPPADHVHSIGTPTFVLYKNGSVKIHVGGDVESELKNNL